MTRRVSISTLLVVPVLSWGSLLLFTHFVPPHTIGAFLVFFLILGVALTSTLTPAAYVISRNILPGWRYRLTIRLALRQSALLSLAIILNLILRALHSWTIFMAVVIFIATAIVEMLFLARKA